MYSTCPRCQHQSLRRAHALERVTGRVTHWCEWCNKAWVAGVSEQRLQALQRQGARYHVE